MTEIFRSTEALGILYAEDFGTDVADFGPAPEAPPPPLTQDDMDAACRDAVQSAWDGWAQGAQARRTAALESVAAGLAEARAEAAQQAELLADSVARTALGLLASTLPQLCRKHGDAEVRALVRALLPSLAGPKRVVIRVHAGLIEALQTDVDGFAENVADHIELRPANLPPGDARLSWEDGGLVRDTAALCAAMQDSLAQLGLFEPLATTAQHTGSFALAE